MIFSAMIFLLAGLAAPKQVGDWPLTGSLTNQAGTLCLAGYSNSVPVDFSEIGTLNGSRLNGASLYAEMNPALSEARGVTICGWFNPSELQDGWSDTSPHTLFRLYDSSAPASSQVILQVLDGKLRLPHYSPAEGITFDFPIQSNCWNFVAMTYDGEFLTVYHNDLPGVSVSREYTNEYDRLLIGASDIAGRRAFKGQVRLIKLYDGGLDEQAVHEIYYLEKPSEFHISGNLLSTGSFENTTREELEASWEFYPANAWQLSDWMAVDDGQSLKTTAGSDSNYAQITLSLPERAAGEVIFGGWMCVRNSEPSRWPLVEITGSAKPAGPPITDFFVAAEPVYSARSQEFRDHTNPVYFEHRFSVPVSYNSLTLRLDVEAQMGEVYFDQLFIAESTNFAADWSVGIRTNSQPSVWRCDHTEYRIVAAAEPSEDNDVFWADVDFARHLFAFNDRFPLDRGSVQIWAVGNNRAEPVSGICDYTLPTLIDHYRHSGLLRWRGRDWADRYEIYFNSKQADDVGSEPAPVFLGAGEILSYSPDTRSPSWGGRPGTSFSVCDVDEDGDLDLYLGFADEGYYLCRNIGSNESPLFAPRTRPLPTDKAPSSMRTTVWMDWDGDGDNDRIIAVKESLGDYTDGALLHLNFGQNLGHGMASAVRMIDENEEEIELSDATWFCIATGDFDNDGAPDVVAGTSMGTLDLLLNRGMNSGRSVVKHALVPFNIFHDAPFDSGEMALRPVVVDWDRDGHDDIVFTSWRGFFWLLRNQGLPGIVSFDPLEQFMQYGGGHMTFGASVTPVAVDWDHDGDLDIISGDMCGKLGYFENIGDRAHPVFAAVVELTNDLGEPVYITAKGEIPIQGPAETMWGYLSCEPWDVDEDGDLDLIINDILGRLRWIENVGTRSEPLLSNRIHSFSSGGSPVITPWRNRPGVTDLDGNGLADLFVLDSVGDLVLYRQSSTGNPSVLSDAEKMSSPTSSTISINFRTNIGSSGHSNIDAGDFDGDGDIDLIISRALDQTGVNYLYCENVGDNTSPVFNVNPLSARGGTFAEWTGTAGHEAWHCGSPEMVDWNGDGKMDFLTGVESGRFTFYSSDYFTGDAFPSVKLLSVEKKTAQGTDKILFNASVDVQELGAQNLPLQALP